MSQLSRRKKRCIKRIFERMILIYDVDGMVHRSILTDELEYWYDQLFQCVGDLRLHSNWPVKRQYIQPDPNKVKAEIRARLLTMNKERSMIPTEILED